MKIKTRNLNPNFTIVLPGPCQANCSFCFWKREEDESAFIKSLKRVLKKLPDNFTQISLSGGEPTLSPDFDKTLKVINKYKKKGKFHKVVLTTNGIHLLKKDLTGIDHINISRHHYKDSINCSIFGTDKVPSLEELSKISTYVNKFGIDINYNVVLTKANKRLDLSSFIDMVKKTGASSIAFRNQYNDYGISRVETEVLNLGYKASVLSTCPVCRTATYIIDGISIKFHSSDYEPTDSSDFDKEETYELILHPTGDLTRDWNAKKIILKRKV